VPEVGVTRARADFHPDHPVAAVGPRHHVAFVDRAPADIVAGFQEKLDASRARQAALRASRDRLGA
jgi:hypothetical protein